MLTLLAIAPPLLALAWFAAMRPASPSPSPRDLRSISIQAIRQEIERRQMPDQQASPVPEINRTLPDDDFPMVSRRP